MVRVFRHHNLNLVHIISKNRLESFQVTDRGEGRHYIERLTPEQYAHEIRNQAPNGMREVHFPLRIKSLFCRCDKFDSTEWGKEHGKSDYGTNCVCTVESTDYDETDVRADEVIAR